MNGPRGEFIEAGRSPVKRPSRRLGPWSIGTWLSWAWWIGLTIFIFHDGVPFWLLAIVGSIAALVAVSLLGGVAWRAAGPQAQRPVRQLSATIDEAFSSGSTALGRTVRRWTVGLFTAGLVLGLLSYGGLDFVPAEWQRITVMIVAPIAVWLGLISFRKRWRPDRDAEVRFGRAVAGLTAGVLLVGSVHEPAGQSHRLQSDGPDPGWVRVRRRVHRGCREPTGSRSCCWRASAPPPSGSRWRPAARVGQPAKAFVAEKTVGLRPTRTYLNYLIAGAREHQLPAEYITMLEAVPVAPASKSKAARSAPAQAKTD